uniref:PFU domain-containing protein n=1 Tax=Nelumbo nucifera TaxID=4432 RepID=A0A822XTU7_NELNU|nr:TPA_asm: hypothetical protein HUJ06_026508 [Nelumbo nucifera]
MNLIRKHVTLLKPIFLDSVDCIIMKN